jgi:capsular exopolysaccharide synthesis family protein
VQRRMQSSPSPSEEAVDLREYAAVIRRRKWLIIVVTGLFTGLMGAYSFSKAPMYTAQTTVIVQPATTSSTYRPDQLVSLDTEARIVTSAPVATMAKEELGWELPIPMLLKRVNVETTPDTLVLDIFFTDGQPADAAAGADAFAKAYLKYKTDQAVNAAVAQRAQVQSTIDGLVERRDKLDRTLDNAVPGTTAYQDAQTERDSVNGNIAVLESQIATISTASDPGTVILPATAPAAPSSPKHVLDLAMGFFFGAFLGVVLAFIRDRTDERITGRSDLEATLDAPVLAAIPRVAGWKKRGPVWLVTERQPRSPAAEAYRTLRSGVMAMARRRDLKVFALLSPVQGEGKTTTAANLAVTLSHTDSRVLLIAADLRRPSLYRYFQLDNQIGLSDVLLGEIPLEEAIQAVSPNLWVLVSGKPPARPAELLQSHQMAELLSRQRERFDYIILDCPPVLGLADSLAIAPLVDAVLLIASAENTKRGAITHALDQLGQVGAQVRGGVLNNVSVSKRNSSYGYGYGYGYGADEAPDDEDVSTLSRLDRVRGRTAPPNGNGVSKAERPRSVREGFPDEPVPAEPASTPEAGSRRES